MNRFIKKVSRFLTPEGLVRPSDRIGEIPDTKTAYSVYVKIAWPAMIESVLVALIGFVDTVMVSTVGTGAIAAVGLTTQPRMLFFSFFFALNMGVIATVSRRRGQEDREGANRALMQTLVLCFALAVVLCAVGIVFARPLLVFAGAKDDTIDDAYLYFVITLIGLGINSLGMLINAAQRGAGNTKIAMRTTVTANIVNVILNFFLINGIWIFPRLGVCGAAIATLCGNSVSALMSFLSVLHKDGFLHLDFRRLTGRGKNELEPVFKVGLGAFYEQIFLRIGFFIFAKIVAELGTDDFAAHQICMNIINLSFAFGDGLGVAASALVGQNLGRQRPDLSILYGKIAQRIGIIMSVLLFCLFMFGGGMLVLMFTDDPYIIEQGTAVMRIIAVVSPAQISQVIFTGCLRGAGDTKFTAAMSMISIGVIRPLLAYVLCYTVGMGIIGAWLALLFDQYLRFILSDLRFTYGKWTKIKL